MYIAYAYLRVQLYTLFECSIEDICYPSHAETSVSHTCQETAQLQLIQPVKMESKTTDANPPQCLEPAVLEPSAGTKMACNYFSFMHACTSVTLNFCNYVDLSLVPSISFKLPLDSITCCSWDHFCSFTN